MKQIFGKIITIVLTVLMLTSVALMPAVAIEPEMTLTVEPVATTAEGGDFTVAAKDDIITFRVSMSSAVGKDINLVAFEVSIPSGFELVAGSALTDPGFLAATGFIVAEFHAPTLALGQLKFEGIHFMGQYSGPGINVCEFKLKATSNVGNNETVSLESIFVEGHSFFKKQGDIIIPSISVPAVINYAQQTVYDINKDGVVSMLDVAYVMYAFGARDGSGGVTWYDSVGWHDSFGGKVLYGDIDFDKDGVITITDIQILIPHFTTPW